VSNFLLIKQIFNKQRILSWFIFAAVPALLFYGIAIEVLSSAGFSLGYRKRPGAADGAVQLSRVCF
jgi:hypothetical protein